MIGFLMI